VAKPKTVVTVAAALLAVVGAVSIAVPLARFVDDVRCNGKAMEPGAYCEVMEGDLQGWRSYEELRADKEGRAGIALLGLGGFGLSLVLASAYLAFAGIRESKRELAQIAAAQEWTRES
jgi:hypothetical protein